MAEKDQPPAPPVGADSSAPKAEAAPERAVAKPIDEKKPKIYDTLKDHLLEANGPANEGNHPRVHEHAALRQFHPVREFDHATESMVMKPHWKMRVLLAWWKGHGLHEHSRISPQHFEAALHEALHGRV